MTGLAERTAAAAGEPVTALASRTERQGRIRRTVAALWRLVSRDTTFALAVGFWVLLLVCAVRPWLFAPNDPLELHPESVLLPPSLHHMFGTDQYGRDVLGQVIHGTRISLLVGLVSTVAAAVVGSVIGIVAGYAGGAIDATIMRLIDVLLCFPGILLALVFQAALGPGRVNVVIAVAVASAPMYARLIRGTVLSIRGRTFVLASRSAGVREPIVVTRHVIPFLFGPILSVATIGLGTAIVLGAALSFLGLGSDDGIADWGLIIGAGQAYMGSAWWIITFPGLVITLVVVTAGVLGDFISRRLTEGSRA
jgi:peptide/nickel transport system permease protein